MKLANLAILTITASFPFSAAQAHHAYANVFDMKSVSQIEGRVVKLELENPHTSLHLKVENEQGQIEDWVLKGPGKVSLARRGWTDDMFEEGELVTVHGNPSVQGKKTMWLDRVIKADGTQMIDPLVADAQAIEEERRARLLKLQQQQQESSN